MKDARGEMGKKEDAAYKRNPKNRKNVGRNVERLVENNYIPTSAAAKRAPPLYTERSERTRQDGRLDAGRRTSIHYYSGTNNRHQQVTPLSGSRTSSHGAGMLLLLLLLRNELSGPAPKVTAKAFYSIAEDCFYRKIIPSRCMIIFVPLVP